MPTNKGCRIYCTQRAWLPEQIYEVCFCHELTKRNIDYQRQVRLPIKYDGLIFDEGLR